MSQHFLSSCLLKCLAIRYKWGILHGLGCFSVERCLFCNEIQTRGLSINAQPYCSSETNSSAIVNLTKWHDILYCRFVDGTWAWNLRVEGEGDGGFGGNAQHERTQPIGSQFGDQRSRQSRSVHEQFEQLLVHVSAVDGRLGSVEQPEPERLEPGSRAVIGSDALEPADSDAPVYVKAVQFPQQRRIKHAQQLHGLPQRRRQGT